MSEVYLGEIRIFAGTFAPVGYHFCDGTLLSISQNTALFALIGTSYGGDGMSNFALPDLRGRVPVSAGQGPALSPYALGQAYGVENVTLTTTTMPAHTHPFNATSATAGSQKPAPSGTMTLGTVPSADSLYYNQAGATIVQLAPTDVGSAGGSLSHTNIMPVLAINFIIALQGIFPST